MTKLEIARQECRQHTQHLRDWQRFAAKLGKLLDCSSVTDDIIDKIKTLKAAATPRKKQRKICYRCSGNKVILHVRENDIGTVKCPDCNGTGFKPKKKKAGKKCKTI